MRGKVGMQVPLIVVLIVVLVCAGCEGPDPGDSPLVAEGPAAPGGVELNLEKVLERVDQFFRDARLYVVLGLIGVDLLMGVASAIKQGAFDWRRVGEFYRSMVVPYVLGYLTLYIAFGFVGLEGLVGEGLVTVAFGFITVNLVASVWEHLKVLGFERTG